MTPDHDDARDLPEPTLGDHDDDSRPDPGSPGVSESPGDPVTDDLDETIGKPDANLEPEPPPATFERQMLSSAVRWVWFVGYLIPSAIATLMVLQIDLFVLPTRTGLVTALTLVGLLALSAWRTATRYRAWSWELDETELVIDRGVVFKLTRIVPRVRVQHVDLSSGPIDRFFNLRQVSIYTAGTREADAAIPGLTSERAEALRQALIASPPTTP